MKALALTSLAALVSVSVVAMPTRASAATITLDAVLSGSNEIPANGSPGHGFAEITVNDVTMQVSWNVSFQDLTALATAGHIHQAPLGVNGPVVIPFSVPNATSGSFSGSTGPISPTLLAGLLAGNTYVNIHTANFPAGEIRGQLVPTPEPTSMLLLASGLIGLSRVRRRRQ